MHTHKAISALPIPATFWAEAAGLRPQTLRRKIAATDDRYRLTLQDLQALKKACEDFQNVLRMLDHTIRQDIQILENEGKE